MEGTRGFVQSRVRSSNRSEGGIPGMQGAMRALLSFYFLNKRMQSN